MAFNPRQEQEETEAAAREARGIGGPGSDSGTDPAEVPLLEGGGGVAEGFEQAERALIEHASHGDDQSAHAILHDQGISEEYTPRVDAEADHEQSSQLGEELP
jgi:hypothetical protein